MLVALAWDSHVHHAAARKWFRAHAKKGWATCAVTEAGFVRVSSNPRALPAAIPVDSAREVLAALREVGAHRFLANDVSQLDVDMPEVVGYRQITDGILVALARRNEFRLVTFDAAAAALAGEGNATLLSV